MVNNNEPTFQHGDKVRVKAGEYKGQRGIVVELKETFCVVALVSGVSVQLTDAELTNYSLAARRAWQKMPKQAGRPKSSKQPKKMVSMRIDPDVWEQLNEAVNLGYVSSRESAVNTWLRERLADYSFDKEDADKE